MFKIEMLPARIGDCLWIEYGEDHAPNRILIDGGTGPTYNDLRARLKALAPDQRHFELLVVTHVDGDHIEGILRLLQDRKLGLQIDDIWFNGWEHIAPGRLGPSEGEMLSGLIDIELKLPWNKAFSKGAVVIPDQGDLPVIPLKGGMKLTLLSPDNASLARLIPTWKTELVAAKLIPGDKQKALNLLKETKRLRPSDVLGAKLPNPQELVKNSFTNDTSRSNASSVAFLAEYNGVSVLLAGDAHPTVLAASLRRLLQSGGANRLSVDAFKIPHHGSASNLNDDLLELLDCPRYLVSTSGQGQQKHPHWEAIARVIVNGGSQPQLFFNYTSGVNQVWDASSLRGKYRYRAVYPVAGSAGMIIEL